MSIYEHAHNVHCHIYLRDFLYWEDGWEHHEQLIPLPLVSFYFDLHRQRKCFSASIRLLLLTGHWTYNKEYTYIVHALVGSWLFEMFDPNNWVSQPKIGLGVNDSVNLQIDRFNLFSNYGFFTRNYFLNVMNYFSMLCISFLMFFDNTSEIEYFHIRISTRWLWSDCNRNRRMSWGK